jgi:exonuclease III
MAAVNRVEFISDRMPYIILRDRWCNIIVLNVHAPTGDKIDDIKDRFYEELEQVFDKLPKYHIKILLGDFNAKVGREDIFKPTIGNESLNVISWSSQLCHIQKSHCQKCDVPTS